MAKRIYNKPPLSFKDQLNLLKTRGLQIENVEKDLSYLQDIGSLRLSAYELGKDLFGISEGANSSLSSEFKEKVKSKIHKKFPH